MVIGAYFHTNLADEISTKVNLFPVGLNRSVTRSCFFLAKGMADGSLGKEIQLKSISDEVVFCHPIIPKNPILEYPKITIGCRISRHTMQKTEHRMRSKRER